MLRRTSKEAEQTDPKIIRLDDETYVANSDVIEGMEFSATLQIRTPLSVLERHGEIFLGPPSQTPTYGSQADGVWVFKTRSFRDMGLDVDELIPIHASDIGPVDPAQYLPFLIRFRSIVESDKSHEEKIHNLLLMPKKSAQFKSLWSKLSNSYSDFPYSFFYSQFTVLPGVGLTTAKKLYDSGFRSVEEIISADVARLTSVPGVGQATARKILALHSGSGA